MSRVGLELLINFIFAIGALLFGNYIGHKHGTEEVQAKWNAEKLTLITAQHDKEAELQSNMDTLRKAYSNETAKLATNVRNLSNSLRNRPERPAVPASAASSAAATAPGCTGAELYKPDGEFLVREAARADAIRIAMIQCQAAYDAAK